MFLTLLSGGFLKGYRTYVLTGVAAIAAIANWAVGDADLMSTINAVAASLGLATVRAAVK